MAAPLQYEPSVAAVIADVLPSGSTLLSGAARTRRVSWVVTARATGLGEIEGGEMVLVPAARSDEVVSRLADLDRAGVAAVVFECAPDVVLAGDLPVITVPVGANVRSLQIGIERYVTRRRRELFALDREMHHLAVDAALGGATIAAVVERVAAAASMWLAIDRDGEVIVRGGHKKQLSESALVRARIASRGAGAGFVSVNDDVPVTALAIMAGRERRGTALAIGNTGNVDDAAVVLTALASACAIILSREPELSLPTLDEWLAAGSMRRPRMPSAPMQCVAFHTPGTDVRSSARAIRLEAGARDPDAELVELNGQVVLIVRADVPVPWPALLASLRARLGRHDVRIGLGRPGEYPSDVRRSATEADLALALSDGDVVAYREVEVRAMLRHAPEWQAFASDCLGSLLRDRDAGGELLETLRAYLQCGRNAVAAASALHVHRNTLLYRLRRIEGCAGADLSDAESLFRLELAVHALDATG